MKAMVVPVLLALSLWVPGGLAQQQGQGPEGKDKNLIMALTQLAGMYACDQMRGRFRTIEAEGQGEQESASGTLWIRECAASAEGDQLALTLGGQGWRWIFREKEKAGAEFEVSQYGKFQVEVALKGRMDARYDPNAQTVRIWFRPVTEPKVNFQPLGEVDVETEGFWSSVVGGVASLVMQSPESQAYEQFASTGHKRFAERFSKGYTAELDFCTGRLQTGFGLNGNGNGNRKSGEQDQQSEGTRAFMHQDGLIIDGPFDAQPDKFQVTVRSKQPVRAELVCAGEAEKVAEAFLQKRQPPDVSDLASARVENETTLQLKERVSCPVALLLRSVEHPPTGAFQFHYQVKTAPLVKTAAQKCENRRNGGSQQQ